MPRLTPEPHAAIRTPEGEKLASMLAGLECRGLSRSEIARRAGVNPSTITRIASGERGVRPSMDLAVRLRAVADDVGLRQPRAPLARPAAPGADPAPLVWRRPD